LPDEIESTYRIRFENLNRRASHHNDDREHHRILDGCVAIFRSKEPNEQIERLNRHDFPPYQEEQGSATKLLGWSILRIRLRHQEDRRQRHRYLLSITSIRCSFRLRAPPQYTPDRLRRWGYGLIG
jgi:hypothetical protein